MDKTLSSYSPDLTSYDLIKSFAVIIMVIDHIGYYFFPDQEWWRAIGRIGFPIWFFLVGHATGRGLPWKLTVGAVFLVALDAATGIAVLPMNALVTIIIIRLCIDPVMNFALKSKLHLWGLSAVLFILIIPTMEYTEYGTLGLITAMFGYMVRHKVSIKEQTGSDDIVFQFMIYAYISFILMMQLLFGFSMPALAFMAAGTFCVRIYLYAFFKKESYPSLSKKTPWVVQSALQLMGRYTLEIYVIHIVIFQLFALYVLNLIHLS